MKTRLEISPPWKRLPDDLPEWLSSDLRAAIMNPSADTLGALIAAGRLLRLYVAPGLSQLRALRSWVLQLSDEVFYLAQEHGGLLFQQGIDCLLRYAQKKKEFLEIFEGYSIVLDKDDQIPLKGHTWVFQEIEARDDLASLQFLLRLAVDGKRTEARLFFYKEVAAMANHWDAVAEKLVDELKHVVARKKIPAEFNWLGEFAVADPYPWWLNVAYFAFATQRMKVPKFLRQHERSVSTVESWKQKLLDYFSSLVRKIPVPEPALLEMPALAAAARYTKTIRLTWRPERGTWYAFAKWPPDTKTGKLEIFFEKLPKTAIGLIAFGKYRKLAVDSQRSACVRIPQEEIEKYQKSKQPLHIGLVLEKRKKPIIGILSQ